MTRPRPSQQFPNTDSWTTPDIQKQIRGLEEEVSDLRARLEQNHRDKLRGACVHLQTDEAAQSTLVGLELSHADYWDCPEEAKVKATIERLTQNMAEWLMRAWENGDRCR